jgi:hypothetical protein
VNVGFHTKRRGASLCRWLGRSVVRQARGWWSPCVHAEVHPVLTKELGGCSVATLPLPQTKASVEQYRSQPQQTRSGWAGFTGNRLFTAQPLAALESATCRIVGTAPCSPTGCAPASPRRTASSQCKAGSRCGRHRRAASLDESRPSTARASVSMFLMLGHHDADRVGDERTAAPRQHRKEDRLLLLHVRQQFAVHRRQKIGQASRRLGVVRVHCLDLGRRAESTLEAADDGPRGSASG